MEDREAEVRHKSDSNWLSEEPIRGEDEVLHVLVCPDFCCELQVYRTSIPRIRIGLEQHDSIGDERAQESCSIGKPVSIPAEGDKAEEET